MTNSQLGSGASAAGSSEPSGGELHLLKVRDNPNLRGLVLEESADGQVTLHEGADGRTPSDLRKEIEPWLTALFQSERLALLVGAGLSTSIHSVATGSPGAGMGASKFSVYPDEIDAAASHAAKAADRGESNIEDQIRAATELLRGLEIIAPESAKWRGSGVLKRKKLALKKEMVRVLRTLAEEVLAAERHILESRSELAFSRLVNFLMSFSSRSATRERLHVFTTNYDRVIEFGAELAGIHLIDRFVGNIQPLFRSSRLDVDMHYNPPGIRGEPRYLEGVVHFTKLHGSLDWMYHDRYVRRIGLPFGAPELDLGRAPGGNDEDRVESLLIYPRAAKDRETSEYPYVDLFRDLAAYICRPNTTLVTYGYSFGDEHINRMIEDMLTVPSTHLVVIAYNDSSGRIQRFYDRVSRPAQLTAMIGSHFGRIESLLDYLPKPALDWTSIRMAELLRSRGIFAENRETPAPSAQGDSNESSSD